MSILDDSDVGGLLSVPPGEEKPIFLRQCLSSWQISTCNYSAYLALLSELQIDYSPGPATEEKAKNSSERIT